MERLYGYALAVAAIVALPAGAASAQGYIGGTISVTATAPSLAEAEVDRWNLSVYGPPNTCEFLGCAVIDDGASGFKLFGGYRFSQHFAVEGFFADLGDHSSFADDGFGVTARADAGISTVGAALVGILPFGADSLFFGKLGVHSWNVDGSYSVVDVVLPGSDSGSLNRSGTDLMLGLGVDIGMSPHFMLRLELESYGLDYPVTPVGVGVVAIGGVYRF